MADENEDMLSDTIEVPDAAAQTILVDDAESVASAEAEAAGVLADAGRDEEQEDGEQEETPEQRKARKKSDYQKRIGELVRARHEAEEARAAAEAKADLLERRLQEAAQGAVSPGDDNKTDLKRLEQELIEKRKEATADADLEAFAEVNDRLTAVRNKMVRQEAERTKEEPAAEAPAEMVPEAKAWLDSNAWFNASGNEHLAGEVLRIERNLLREGYNLKDPQSAKELYNAIDEEIRQRPEFDEVIGVITPSGEAAVRKPQPRSHIAPPSRGGEAPERAKPGELKPQDITAIRRAGLDPNDPKVRATFLKYKRN